MSPIAPASPTREISAPRTPPVPAAPATASAEPATESPRRQTTPLPAADATPDARFDRDATRREQVVRQVAQQIAASMVYGAHVSVVSTHGGVHATIDVSA